MCAQRALHQSRVSDGKSMGTRREPGADGGSGGGGTGETGGAQDADRTLLGDAEVVVGGRFLGARQTESGGGSEPGAFWLQPEASVGGGGIEKTAGGVGDVQAQGQTQREPRGDWVGKAARGPSRPPPSRRRVATGKGNLARRSNAAGPSMNPQSIFHTGSKRRAPSATTSGWTASTRRWDFYLSHLIL